DKGDDQETCGNRIPGPAVRGRIGGIAPCQHEASRRQRDEAKQAEEIMKDSVNGYGYRARFVWVTQPRVGHEDPSPDEAEAKDTEQDGPPGGTTSCAQEQPDPDGKTEHERSADDEVGALHPPALP